MRLFLIAALLLVASGDAQKPRPPAQRGTQERNTASPQQQSQSSPHDRSVVSIQECAGCFSVQEAGRQSQQEHGYNPQHDSLYRWYLGANIAAAVVALIGIGFLYAQSRATANAAEAALLNATAVMDSERARLRVDLEIFNGLGGAYFRDGRAYAAINVRTTNIGKTPAWIFEIILNMESLNRIPFEPKLIGDGSYKWRDSPRYLEAGKDFTEQFMLDCEGSGIIVMIHGFIGFQDVYDKDGMCTFGYTFTTDMAGFDRIQNPRYNRNTYNDKGPQRPTLRERISAFVKRKTSSGKTSE